MSQWSDCDDAIEALVTADPTLLYFDRNDIAAELGCTRNEASHILQIHRKAQRRGLTRFVCVAQDYARAAVWLLISGPGLQRMIDRGGVLLGHVEYVASDAAARLIRDLQMEVDPALSNHPALQVFLTHIEANMKTQIINWFDSIHAATVLVESVTGTTADRDRVFSLNGTP